MLEGISTHITSFFAKKTSFSFMKIGMNFGDSAVSFLERLFPEFKNKEEGPFKDIYLKDVGLSKKEKFKRKVKEPYRAISQFFFLF
jgi:hypothetical protein